MKRETDISFCSTVSHACRTFLLRVSLCMVSDLTSTAPSPFTLRKHRYNIHTLLLPGQSAVRDVGCSSCFHLNNDGLRDGFCQQRFGRLSPSPAMILSHVRARNLQHRNTRAMEVLRECNIDLTTPMRYRRHTLGTVLPPWHCRLG